MIRIKNAVILGAALSAGLGAAGLAGAQTALAPVAPQCAEPTGAHGCSFTIQGAIDAAAAGATINVYPGDYNETAAGRWVLASTPMANGPHQFGLFIDSLHGGITVQGVDANGKKITDNKKVQAYVTTNATNNFGYSGIFVEGDDVTITALRIGPNIPGDEKTIEVIGDGFTLKDSVIDVPLPYGGSVYLNDWRFDDVNAVSYLQSYEITENSFLNGTSIDIASGAGFSGRVTDRRITKNSFANSGYWPSISFNGSDTGVPWFVYSVGGAEIVDNTFVNTFTTTDPLYLLTEGHIRARGTYDNSQFAWDRYFNANKFDKAYATGPKPPRDLRAYSYPGSYGTINNVRRIGALLEGEEAIAQPGDKTAVKPK